MGRMKRSGARRGGSKAPAKKANANVNKQAEPELVTLAVDFSSGPCEERLAEVRQQASTVQKLLLQEIGWDALRSVSEMQMPQLVFLDISCYVAEAGKEEGSAEATPAADSPWWEDRGAEGSSLATLRWTSLQKDRCAISAPTMTTARPIVSLLSAHRHTLREVRMREVDPKYNAEVRKALAGCALLDSADLPCGYVSHVPRVLPADLHAHVKVPPVGPPLPASLRRLVLRMGCGSMYCLERLPKAVRELVVQSFAIDGEPVLPVLSELKQLTRLELHIGWGSKKESAQARRQLAAALPRAKVMVPYMLEFVFGPQRVDFLLSLLQSHCNCSMVEFGRFNSVTKRFANLKFA